MFLAPVPGVSRCSPPGYRLASFQDGLWGSGTQVRLIMGWVAHAGLGIWWGRGPQGVALGDRGSSLGDFLVNATGLTAPSTLCVSATPREQFPGFGQGSGVEAASGPFDKLPSSLRAMPDGTPGRTGGGRGNVRASSPCFA